MGDWAQGEYAADCLVAGGDFRPAARLPLHFRRSGPSRVQQVEHDLCGLHIRHQ